MLKTGSPEKVQAGLALLGFCIPWLPQVLGFKLFGKGWGGTLRCSLVGLGIGMYGATVSLPSVICHLFNVIFVLSFMLFPFRFFLPVISYPCSSLQSLPKLCLTTCYLIIPPQFQFVHLLPLSQTTNGHLVFPELVHVALHQTRFLPFS